MAQVAPAAVTTSEEHLTNDVDGDETDNVTALELHRNRRVLYFSDGTMEQSSSSESDDNDTLDKGLEPNIHEHDMSLVSRFKHRASKVGSGVLAGIDYVGGGLASFFGITTPKYASEVDYSKRDGTWTSVGNSGAEIIPRYHHRHDINKNNIA